MFGMGCVGLICSPLAEVPLCVSAGFAVIFLCSPSAYLLWRISLQTGYTGEKDADGKAHGKGARVYWNGEKYDEEWEHGEKHGKGVQTWGGNTYEAEFVRGEMDGKGVITFANGDKYEGGWENGKEHGKGVLTFANKW
jgi:hypothetical protein